MPKDPSLGMKVRLLAQVLSAALIPPPSDIEEHEQLYYGCCHLDTNGDATGDDFHLGCQARLYQHVRQRACHASQGCFHWSNAKTTLGCRMSAWRGWLRSAKNWLKSPPEEKLRMDGPALAWVTLDRLMRHAGVSFCDGQRMGDVVSGLDCTINAAVGGVGPGAPRGWINISTKAGNNCQKVRHLDELFRQAHMISAGFRGPRRGKVRQSVGAFVEACAGIRYSVICSNLM